MWLKKLVAVSMIIAFVGMNTLAILGIVLPNKQPEALDSTTAPVVESDYPTVDISVTPSAVQVGDSATIEWKTSGNPTSCVAGGSWSGPKTPFGAESTGIITEAGTLTYTISCSNTSGKADAIVNLVASVSAPEQAAAQPGASSPATPVVSAPVAPVYCSGRTPCYGPGDLAAHASSGNCWGWNADRVVNITGFDASYHIAKSGVSTIEVSGICGKDLAGSLNGSVAANGETHNHKSATKSNSDRNEIPYFIGYYDNAKR